MARYSKIVKKKKSSPLSFMPEPVQAFLAKRFVDILGFLFLIAGVFIALSLLSYSADDPSINTAPADRDGIGNWMGITGAYIADIFYQTLGYAAYGIAAVFCVWSLRIFKREFLGPFSLRIASLLAFVLLGSITLTRISADSSAETLSYLGGSSGILLMNQISLLLSKIGITVSHNIIATVSVIMCLAAGLFAAKVSREELRTALIFCKNIITAALSSLYYQAHRFIEWVRHYNDPDYQPSEALIKKAPKAKKEEAAKIAPSINASAPAPVTAAAPQPAAESIKIVTPAADAGKKSGKQKSLGFEIGDWDLPPHDLLQEVPEDTQEQILDDEALRQNAELLQSVLSDFNIEGEIVSIHPGPVVTLYEFEPAPGVKTQRIISLADDIARSMAAVSVRCAVIPGRNVIGIEMPNTHRQVVYMRDVMEAKEVQKSKAALPLILGKDIGGKPIIADLAKMPHLLVAGTTGSGKSVAVNTMILSLLYKLPPEKCRFIMIDPKMLELSVYDDIPHLLSPVVTEPGKAVVSLKWAVQEMEERYRAMSKLGVRNLEGYNERIRQALKKGETLMRKVQTGFDADTGKPVYEEQPFDMTELPYIVIIVDEFADLMLVAGKDVENAVQRLAQMARAAGIHLIMATQRPSVDVITGIIKANFPTRISFQVTSKVDSRTILNEGGAEQLLGMGDMLYMAAGGRVTRVHGPFVSDEDVEGVVNFLKAQGEPAYLREVTEGGFEGDSDVMSALFGEGESNSEFDELYDKAVAIVAREQKASTSFIQRQLQIGYNRAANIIEDMEKQGVIGPANHVGKREVLVQDLSDA